MSRVFQLFKMVIIAQLFFGTAITLLAYALPADMTGQVNFVQENIPQSSVESISTDVEEALERQTNIPVIDVGALVFYSGNILADLVINFIFAIPTALSLLINLVLNLISVDPQIMYIIQGFFTAAITTLYAIGVINLFINIRSGRVIQ